MTRFLEGFLLLSLAGCATSERVTCPQPPPSLLTPEPPLDASLLAKEPIPLPVLLEAYAVDIGRYHSLRQRHSDLQGWVLTHCLAQPEGHQ